MIDSKTVEFKPISHTEQKPNLKQSSLKEDFRRQNLSPNTAEGKERLGLKDLAKLAAEAGKVEYKTTKKGNKHKKKKGKANSTPVIPPVKSKKESTPVKPEVEYQEKTAAEIAPSHHSTPLSTPINRTDHYAEKDNSVDGFLAIKH